MSTSERARMGGIACAKKHGKAHMREIGKRGFQTTVDRHWNGDRSAYAAYLREQGLLAACDEEFRSMLELYQEQLPELLGRLS